MNKYFDQLNTLSGQWEQCIATLEQMLANLQQAYGYEHSETLKVNARLASILNHQGVQLLQKKQFQKSLEYLKKAELLSVHQDSQKVMTFNNLGCFYRKTGKPRTALQYLQEALNLELTQLIHSQSNRLPSSPTLSETYLNLCAVLSQLDKHDEAIQHVYLSIIMLQHEILTELMNSKSYSSERITILVIAYYNLGVEMEFLKKDLEAKKIFQSAMQLAKENLPANHLMVQNLKKVIKESNNNPKQQLKLNLPKVLPPKRYQEKTISFESGSYKQNSGRITNDQIYLPKPSQSIDFAQRKYTFSFQGEMKKEVPAKQFHGNSTIHVMEKFMKTSKTNSLRIETINQTTLDKQQLNQRSSQFEEDEEDDEIKIDNKNQILTIRQSQHEIEPEKPYQIKEQLEAQTKVDSNKSITFQDQDQPQQQALQEDLRQQTKNDKYDSQFSFSLKSEQQQIEVVLDKQLIQLHKISMEDKT